jgi:hypothetical protein
VNVFGARPLNDCLFLISVALLLFRRWPYKGKLVMVTMNMDAIQIT